MSRESFDRFVKINQNIANTKGIAWELMPDADGSIFRLTTPYTLAGFTPGFRRPGPSP